MRRSLPIAFFGAILGAALLVTLDCTTGTHEQCLMSKGLSWMYALALFVVIWIIAALVLLARRGSSRDDDSSR